MLPGVLCTIGAIGGDSIVVRYLQSQRSVRCLLLPPVNRSESTDMMRVKLVQ